MGGPTSKCQIVSQPVFLLTLSRLTNENDHFTLCTPYTPILSPLIEHQQVPGSLELGSICLTVIGY